MPVDRPRKLWLRSNEKKDMASETWLSQGGEYYFPCLVSVRTPVPFRKKWGSLKGQELLWKKKEK